MARIAKSLDTLRNQFNTLYPKRDKSADGWIGDRAHAARASDHNPDARGVVKALDITHDPKVGLDAGVYARRIAASKDPRISYIISNGEICSSTVSPWKWRKYTGSNPHRAHFHVSVAKDPKLYDSTKPWMLGGVTPAPVAKPKVTEVEPKPSVMTKVANLFRRCPNA